jgi:hypothetical protein
MGGLSRRMTVINELPNPESLLIVESPNFAWKSKKISETKIAQQRRKASFIFETFREMNIGAVGIGEGEASLGLDWIITEAQKYEIPLVASNLKCDDYGPFPVIQRSQIGELNIGVLSVLRESTKIDGCQTLPIEGSITDILLANEDIDTWVVLSMINENEQIVLAQNIPELDFIIDGFTKAIIQPSKPLPNNTLRLSMGSRGKHFGVLELVTENIKEGYQSEDRIGFYQAEVDRLNRRLDTLKSKKHEDELAKTNSQRRVDFFTAELEKATEELALQQRTEPTGNIVSSSKFDLSKEVQDDPTILAALHLALDDIHTLESSREYPKYSGPFVGSPSCKSCHESIYEQWSKTPHAHAWTTLVNEKRSMDLDCYSCHSTGALHPEGPQHPTQLGSLIGVGCESCHGAGSEHVQNPSASNIEKTVGETVCTQCHDGVKDEGRFDYPSYYPKVVHRNEHSGN